jgi:hypothetical protein
MFRSASIFSAAILLTALAFASPQASIQQGLNDGRNKLDAGDYPEAVQTLTSVDRRLNGDTPKELSVSVKLYLGASLFFNGKPADAEEVFQQLCRIDPSYEMNRTGREFKQEIVNLFQKAKRTCAEELTTQCVDKCSNANQVILERDPIKISNAVEALGTQCTCDDVRAKAAQTVLDVANESFNLRDPKAKSQFEIAVRISPTLKSRVPMSGTIRVTVAASGGRLSINGMPVKEFGITAQATTQQQEFLLPPGKYELSLEPADKNYSPAVGGIDLGADKIALVELTPVLKVATPPPTPPAVPKPSPQSVTLSSGEYFDFNLGKKSDNGDVMLFERNGSQQLVPQGRTEFAVLPAGFNQATPMELRNMQYKPDPVPVTSAISIAVKTSLGKIVTARVSKSGPSSLMIEWIAYP